MEISLRCENINKSFDGVRALSDVSIQFPSAGCVGIIGPNGAGKSTLLNVVTGFVSADSGSCFLGETKITSLSPHEIVGRGLARTFQEVRLIGGLSVLDNIMLAQPRQCGERLWNSIIRSGVAAQEAEHKDRAIELLTVTGLVEKSLDGASDLSYGQQKLLSICCCVATGADILFLDEPVSGIHPEMADRISRYITDLAHAGKLIVFIEHDIAMVRQTAERIIVMDAGRIIADGEPNEILGRPDILEAYIS